MELPEIPVQVVQVHGDPVRKLGRAKSPHASLPRPARDQIVEAINGIRRVLGDLGLIPGPSRRQIVHRSPDWQVGVRKQAEQKKPGGFENEPHLQHLLPIHHKHEEEACWDEQPAGYVVRQGEAAQEGAEQEVAIPAGFTPDQENEDSERHEERVQRVDLSDDCLAPEDAAYAEGKGSGRSRERPPGEEPADQEHEKHRKRGVYRRRQVDSVRYVPNRKVREELAQHHVGRISGVVGDAEHVRFYLEYRGVAQDRQVVVEDGWGQRAEVKDE